MPFITGNPGATSTAGFSPRSVGGGCQLWLDAADASTLSLSSTVVTGWRDKSGNTNNTTSVGGSPTYSSNFINFNGSSTYLVGPYINTTQYLTMIIVGSVNFSQGIYGYFYRLLSVGSTVANDYNNIAYASILHNPNTTQIGGYRNTVTNYGSVTTNTPFLIVLQYDGTNTTNYINGTSTSVAASTGSFGTSSYSIGRDVGNIDGVGPAYSYTYWPGTVGEVIIYNSSLSTGDRQSVEGYLAQKWGLTASLPGGHPGLTTNFLVGPPSIFRITHSPGTKPPFYITAPPILIQNVGSLSITIIGSSAGAVSSYPIPITVYRTAGTNSGSSAYVGTAIAADYSNLYFTSSDQTTQIPFYIESSTVTATSATIWVNVPSIPTSPSTTKIYLYWYLSGTYTSPSNGTTTFTLFDDFTGSSGAAPSNLWSVQIKGSGGTATLSGSGTVRLAPTLNTISSANLLSVNTVPANNFCIRVRRQYSSENYVDVSISASNTLADDGSYSSAGGTTNWWHTTLTNSYIFWQQAISAGGQYIIKYPAASGKTLLTGSVGGFGAVNTWEIHEMSYTSSGLISWYHNGVNKTSVTDTSYLSGNKYLLLSQGAYSAGQGGILTMDYVMVRNYVSPEPVVSII